MAEKKKILLISSSTGGHAIPILELAKALSHDGHWEYLILHSGSAIEKELFATYKQKVIRSGKIHRHQPLRNFTEIVKICCAVFSSLWLIIIFRPDVIFSKGGFNAVPTLFWAKLFHIPYYLHETDSEMGASNKLYYRTAKRTFVSFPIEQYHLEQKNLEHSGFIVRDFKNEKKEFNAPLIFVIGGSQGSHTINKTVLEILDQLLKKYYVVHATGEQDYEEIKNYAQKLSPEQQSRYIYYSFSLDKANKYLPQADLVITRSGGTIADLAKLGKASILIPYPYAANDHQVKNAKFIEKAGGAIMIREENLTAKRLLDRINFVMTDSRNIEVIASNAKRALKVNGTEYILEKLNQDMSK